MGSYIEPLVAGEMWANTNSQTAFISGLRIGQTSHPHHLQAKDRYCQAHIRQAMSGNYSRSCSQDLAGSAMFRSTGDLRCRSCPLQTAVYGTHAWSGCTISLNINACMQYRQGVHCQAHTRRMCHCTQSGFARASICCRNRHALPGAVEGLQC